MIHNTLAKLAAEIRAAKAIEAATTHAQEPADDGELTSVYIAQGTGANVYQRLAKMSDRDLIAAYLEGGI